MVLLTCSTLLFTQLIGCNSTDAETQPEAASSSEQNMSTEKNKTPKVKVSKPNVSNELTKDMMWYQGAIKYLPMEGGFYGIITKDGHKYLPMNLAAEYRQNGAIIKFKGKLLKDLNTIQQWGTPFKISEIKLIKAGSKSNAADM